MSIKQSKQFLNKLLLCMIVLSVCQNQPFYPFNKKMSKNGFFQSPFTQVKRPRKLPNFGDLPMPFAENPKSSNISFF